MITKELFDNINSYHKTLIGIPYTKISCTYDNLIGGIDVGVQLYRYSSDIPKLTKYVYDFIYNDKDFERYKNRVKKEIMPFIFFTSNIKTL